MTSNRMMQAIGRLERALGRLEQEADRVESAPRPSSSPAPALLDPAAARAALLSLDELITELKEEAHG